MSDIDELVAWLRAQIDEDEDLAREAGRGERGEWVAVDLAFVDDSKGRQVVCDEHMTPGVQAHIVRHDPARVLREVEAKRGILDIHVIAQGLSEYERSCGCGKSFGCTVCHEWDGIVMGDGYCRTLLTYLTNPVWVGDAVPDWYMGYPWGLGGECWYVRAYHLIPDSQFGWDIRRTFAGMDPEAVLTAAQAWLDAGVPT